MNLETEIKEIIEQDGVDSDEFEMVQEGDWVNDYKDYCLRTDIIKYKDRFFRVDQSRMGSYYSDYEYSTDEVTEVVPVTETVTITKYVVKG